MLKLGHTTIGKYTFWIAPADKSLDLDHNHYLMVLVTKSEPLQDQSVTYYVNLIKSKDFSFIFNVDKDYRPTKLCDMTQYNHYMDHKEIQMPLWKISKNNVVSLLNKCQELL